MKRGRKPIPEEMKAKNFTIKVYDWEKEPIKEFVKKMRYENGKQKKN